MAKACCLPLRVLLILTDGWSAYPNSIRRAFREKIPKAGGREWCVLEAWPDLLIGTVIKKTAKKRVVEVIRRLAQGSLEQAKGGKELNTAFIEHFNGTMRERLASLTRQRRHVVRRVNRLEAGMWLVGCPSNFCWPHHELSRQLAKAQACKGEVLITPAMASGLTDHVWSVREVLTYRIVPTPWIAPKWRGRPKALTQPAALSSPARPRPVLRL
jgi:IS1 family transposase